MARLSIVILVAHLVLAGGSNIAVAEVSIVQRSGGTAGTMTHLGDETHIYPDAHGNTGPVADPTRPAPIFGGPHGETAAGPLTPYGTPAPPSGLTPAPILPFSPNRALVPPPPAAPSITPPGAGPSSGGRFGR